MSNDNGFVGVSWWLDTPPDSSGPVNTADLERAMDRMREQSYIVHGSVENPHLFHPADVSQDGWATCLTCLIPMPVRGDRVDWEWGLGKMKDTLYG